MGSTLCPSKSLSPPPVFFNTTNLFTWATVVPVLLLCVCIVSPLYVASHLAVFLEPVVLCHTAL